MMKKTRVGVFCSSQNLEPAYQAQAVELGRLLAENGMGLVFGGGNVGLMGLVSRTAYEAGAEVIGITTKEIVDVEPPNHHQTELIVIDEKSKTRSLSERTTQMMERADAFIVLPGGYGTLEEVSKAITHKQLGFHDKEIIFVNSDGYFDPLLSLFERMAFDNAIRPDDTRLWRCVPNVAQAVAIIKTPDLKLGFHSAAKRPRRSGPHEPSLAIQARQSK